MKGLRLIATGGALPGRTVTNEELSRTVDTSDEWITTRTGIRTRHYCTEGENAATLAIAAAKQALQRSGLAPADIACCVCATLSAPDATPSVACQVQAALALPENRPALDVNAACSGFLYGTAVARGLLATLGGQYALVIGTEALSRLMDPADRSTCVLFGDGAGAAVFELTDTSVPFAITLGARGDAAIHAGGPSRAQAQHPSAWTAGQCSALQWMPCPNACTPCWTRPALRWTIWTGGLPSGPTAASSTTASRRCTPMVQSSTKTWTATRQHQCCQRPGGAERAG